MCMCEYVRVYLYMIHSGTYSSKTRIYDYALVCWSLTVEQTEPDYPSPRSGLL